MSPSLGPRLPQGGFVFRAVTECLIQVWGTGGNFSHPYCPTLKGLSVAPYWAKARSLPTHRSCPSSVGDGNARSSRPMLIRTWLVSGQTWGMSGW